MTMPTDPLRSGMTLPTALAAPVEAGMMFCEAVRPSRHAFALGPSTVFCVAVYAWIVVMSASTMPNLSLITFASGARQLVVHDALLAQRGTRQGTGQRGAPGSWWCTMRCWHREGRVRVQGREGRQAVGGARCVAGTERVASGYRAEGRIRAERGARQLAVHDALLAQRVVSGRRAEERVRARTLTTARQAYTATQQTLRTPDSDVVMQWL